MMVCAQRAPHRCLAVASWDRNTFHGVILSTVLFRIARMRRQLLAPRQPPVSRLFAFRLAADVAGICFGPGHWSTFALRMSVPRLWKVSTTPRSKWTETLRRAPLTHLSNRLWWNLHQRVSQPLPLIETAAQRAYAVHPELADRQRHLRRRRFARAGAEKYHVAIARDIRGSVEPGYPVKEGLLRAGSADRVDSRAGAANQRYRRAVRDQACPSAHRAPGAPCGFPGGMLAGAGISR